jgi:hypothetical protein
MHAWPQAQRCAVATGAVQSCVRTPCLSGATPAKGRGRWLAMHGADMHCVCMCVCVRACVCVVRSAWRTWPPRQRSCDQKPCRGLHESGVEQNPPPRAQLRGGTWMRPAPVGSAQKALSASQPGRQKQPAPQKGSCCFLGPVSTVQVLKFIHRKCMAQLRTLDRTPVRGVAAATPHGD